MAFLTNSKVLGAYASVFRFFGETIRLLYPLTISMNTRNEGFDILEDALKRLAMLKMAIQRR